MNQPYKFAKIYKPSPDYKLIWRAEKCREFLKFDFVD